MTEQRERRLYETAFRRQLDCSVILENVHDPHNIGAVLRTCESVGIYEIFVLHTDPNITVENLYLGKNASSGARRWLKVNYYRDLELCFKAVRSRYTRILSTHLDKKANSIYQTDFTTSIALLLGNEKDGVSPEAQYYADGNLIIPQYGMVQSLNISVACAITLYELCRQRAQAGLYEDQSTNQAEKQALFQHYKDVHNNKIRINRVEEIKD